MTSTVTASQGALGLSYTSYTEDESLQSAILSVVDGIILQDSRDRGAWDRVVVKRIALSSSYSEGEVEREIDRMLKACSLYESCYEIRNGTFPMRYIRNSDELKGGDNE